MNIKVALSNDRTMKALTAVSVKEFQGLLPGFEAALLEQKNKQKRQRKVGSGRKGVLKESAEQLLFILFYLKVYPTFDLAGVLFDVDRSRPCRWVQAYLPILEKLFGHQCVLPKRRIKSMQEFIDSFPEIKDIFVDGTERPIQRPGSARKQKSCYSGKKKRHMRKNLVMCDHSKHILLVSPSNNGKVHDKKQLEKEGWVGFVPEQVTVWVDRGFLGISKYLRNADALMMPKNKPKGRELNEQEKQDNRLISGIRIVVEQAIGGIKRLGVVKQTYRNRKGQDDKFILLSAALCNYHLTLS